jgi:hypothetical protein
MGTKQNLKDYFGWKSSPWEKELQICIKRQTHLPGQRRGTHQHLTYLPALSVSDALEA